MTKELTPQELNEPVHRYLATGYPCKTHNGIGFGTPICSPRMAKDELGEYVLHADYLSHIATLTKKCERLEKALDRAIIITELESRCDGCLSCERFDEYVVTAEDAPLVAYLKSRDGR